MRILPIPGEFGTSCADKLATVVAEASYNTLLALLTLGFLRLLDFLYGIMNLKEIVEVKSSSEA